MTFTLEQINKAKQAKSAEELLAIAKASGVELTEEEAAKYFAEFHKEGELSDEELDNVAGGKWDDEPQVVDIPAPVFNKDQYFELPGDGYVKILSDGTYTNGTYVYQAEYYDPPHLHSETWEESLIKDMIGW